MYNIYILYTYILSLMKIIELSIEILYNNLQEKDIQLYDNVYR